MRFCSYLNEQGKSCVGGILAGGSVGEIKGYSDMNDLIARYNTDKDAIAAQLAFAASQPFDSVHFLSVVTQPQKIFMVGLNYLGHAKEFKYAEIPPYPTLFSKFNNALNGHRQPIVIPKDCDTCDYEAELAFIVGKTARRVSEADALDYVFGYTICNDVSDRHRQKRVPQWLTGKTADTFCPIGPVVVTRDEIPNPHALPIRCLVNGKVRQQANTGDMIFTVARLLSSISETITLYPGDVVSTGTPAGVAMGMNPPAYLQPGDVVRVEIDGIGALENPLVAET